MISVRADAPKDLDHSKNTIRILMEAIGEEVRVKMQYYSVHSQQKKTYTIDPYRLMYFRGGLYLFARVEEYNQIRTFAVERIESIEKTRDEFEKPPDFSVESYLESAFGVVKEILSTSRSSSIRTSPSTCGPGSGTRRRWCARLGEPYHDEDARWRRIRAGLLDPQLWAFGYRRFARASPPARGSRAWRALENYRMEVTVAQKIQKSRLQKGCCSGGPPKLKLRRSQKPE